MFVLVSVCVLVPSVAHANDGGWWDWLWKWDAKFMGVGSEIHLLCLDDGGDRLAELRAVVQEHRPRHRRKPIQHRLRRAIKHQIDFRFGYYWNHGTRRYDRRILPATGRSTRSS